VTRIVAGLSGGRSIAVPASGTRPTSERVREALFSRLDHLGVVSGARVADLYAGSGALGLEAASRGADRVVLVEQDAAAVRVCRSNARVTGLADRIEVVADRVERFVTRPMAPFDLVLLDPPYALVAESVTEVLEALLDLTRTDAVVVVERSVRSTPLVWPDGLQAEDDRRYGETRVWTAVRT